MSRRPYFIAGLDLYRQGGNFLYSLHSPWVIYENVARKNIIGNSFTYQTSKKKSYFFSSRRESLLDVIQNKIDSWNWKKREREREIRSLIEIHGLWQWIKAELGSLFKDDGEISVSGSQIHEHCSPLWILIGNKPRLTRTKTSMKNQVNEEPHFVFVVKTESSNLKVTFRVLILKATSNSSFLFCNIDFCKYWFDRKDSFVANFFSMIRISNSWK